MDLNRSKKLLFKIQTLLESLSYSDESISPLERDLLKSYVRRLYDAILEEGHGKTANATTDPGTLKPLVKQDKQEEKSAIVHGSPPDRPETAPPAEENKDDSAAEEKTGPRIGPQQELQKPDKGSGPTFLEAGPLEALFAVKPASDLSEKFSLTPIEDIAKGMGINERIAVIHELFGGSQQLFKESIDVLNGMTDFDEAKRFLVNGVAADLDWGSKDKMPKAKQFIQLIRRKCLADENG